MHRETSSSTLNIHPFMMESLAQKLGEIRELDPELMLFGSEMHGYEVNGPLDAAMLAVFERLYKIQLPSDFRAFLYYFGDGGAGPYYGLCPLGMSLYLDMDYPDELVLLEPGKEFPLTEAQLPPGHTVSLTSIGQHPDENSVDDGIIRLCNYGNGVFINLVVTGPAAGQIWTDARNIRQGVYPGDPMRPNQYMTFMEWYNHWLNDCLEAIHSNQESSN